MKQPNDKTIAFIDNYSGRKFNLIGSSADQSVIGAIESAGGFWEPHLINLFHRLVRPESICLDIGANIGVHSLVMADLACNGHVYAFEPSSMNFGYLKQNLAINQIRNVSVHQLGLSNVAGPRPFHTLVDVPGASFAGDLATPRNIDEVIQEGLNYNYSYTSETAEFSTLDEWVAEHKIETVDFVKMDVEGSEDFVISGGMSFLKRVKPLFISELNVKTLKHYFGIEPENYFARLAGLYEYIYLIDHRGGLVRVRDFGEISATLTEAKYWSDILCSSTEISAQILDRPARSSQAADATEVRFDIGSPGSVKERPGAGTDLHDASGTKVKVLYFTVVPLSSMNNGGTLCCRNHVMQLAADPLVDLTFVTTGPSEWADGHRELAESIGGNTIHIPFQEGAKSRARLPDILLFPHEKWACDNPQVNERFTSIAEEVAPDVVVVDYLQSALYIRSVFDRPTPRVVITLNREADFFKAQRRSGQMPGPALCSWITNIRLRLWERWVQKHCTGLVALSANDLPKGLPQSILAEVLTPTFGRSAARWSYKGNKDAFFVGNILHYPNRMAMEWICTKLAPETEMLDPEIRFRLIGATEQEVPVSWRLPCIEFLGRADDVEVARRFSESALFVAPISNDFGSKMKLLECLSHGTPFIATPAAMSGLPYLKNRATIDLDRPRDVAIQISQMLNFPEGLDSRSRCNEELTVQFRASQKGAWGRYMKRVIASAEG